MEREVHVSVTNGTKGAAQATVALELPAGLEGRRPPARRSTSRNEDEALSARFQVTAPAQAKTGEYTLRAVVTSAGTGHREVRDGYQEIEYPHIQRRQIIKPAESGAQGGGREDGAQPHVGYIVGVGDQVPPAIEQLGAKVAVHRARRARVGRPLEVPT